MVGAADVPFHNADQSVQTLIGGFLRFGQFHHLLVKACEAVVAELD